MSPKGGGGGNRKRGNDAGVLPTNFPRPVRWKIDQDYANQLSPADREWLAHFNDAYYGGDFRGTEPGEWAPEERRAAWAEQRSAKRDVYTLASLVEGNVTELLEDTASVDAPATEYTAAAARRTAAIEAPLPADVVVPTPRPRASAPRRRKKKVTE